MNFPFLTNLVSCYFDYIEIFSLISALGIALSCPAAGWFHRHLIILYGAFPILGLIFIGFNFEGVPQSIGMSYLLLIVIWLIVIYFFSKNLDRKVSEYLSDKSKNAVQSQIRRKNRIEIGATRNLEAQNHKNPEDYL